MNFFEANQVKFFFGLLLLVNVFLTGLVIFSVGDGKYFLAHEDEAIYYCSAKLFSETNSVQAEGCNEEDVSPIGRINWYGPGFHIIYGTLFKIFGSHAILFPLFHYTLAIVILLMIYFFLPTPLENKLSLMLTLSLTQQFFLYVFTFFPETLILNFSVVLTILLYLQHHEKDSIKRKRLEFLYILLILIFCLFRVTFVFWILGWVTLGKGNKVILLRAGVFVVIFMMSLVYMKMFLAPTWSDSVKKIDLLLQGNILSFIQESIRSVYLQIIEILKSLSIPIYTFFCLFLGAWLYYLVIEKTRLGLSTLIISTSLVLTFLAYYVVHNFFFVKQTAMLIPLLLLGMVTISRNWKIQYGVVAILLIIFPSRIIQARKNIMERREAFINYTNFEDLRVAFSEIPNYIQSDPTIILWAYNEYDYGNCAEALLSFSTNTGEPIMYTTNVVPPDAEPEIKFQLRGKLKVDYLLSRRRIEWPFLQEIHSNNYYTLYKINRK